MLATRCHYQGSPEPDQGVPVKGGGARVMAKLSLYRGVPGLELRLSESLYGDVKYFVG